MADNADRSGRGWAIAGAFAAQAVIFAGIGALLTGAGTVSVATSSSAVPAPMFGPVKPPFISMQKGAPADFPYTLSVDGQTGSGVFLGGQPAPSYTVTPGQDLTLTLDLAIPPTLNISSVTVGYTEAGTGTQTSQDQTAYDAKQPLTPGQQAFTLVWTGSASELQPGTTWSIFMSTNSPGPYNYNDGLIATVTVGS